jgi:hypothetical protein
MPIDYGNMSVPGSSGLLGGSNLLGTLDAESEEARRKRLLAQQQARLLPSAGAAGMASLGTSPMGFAGAAGGFR